MHKKSLFNSASVSPRALVILLVCAATCLIVTRTLPAFFQSQAPANVSQRTLTFAERVAYQRAIEDVYWRHRIWPKNGPDPKPSLDAVMSQAQLEKRVSDYLRKSQALEDYWQRPITAEQLQAEMDRMAKHSKQPDVLRELFEALGNDPLAIAECLARPVLAERLLTNWYAYDERIHGELRQRAEADLAMHPTVEQMKQTTGRYSETELVNSDSGEKNNRAAEHSVKLNTREWDQTVQKLAAIVDGTTAAAAPKAFAAAKGDGLAQIKTGVLSPLQEDETRYYATAVLSKTNDHLKLGTVLWVKEPLDSWLSRAEEQLPNGITAPNATYTLPKISDGAGCTDNTWTATAADAPTARAQHTAVWTGSEMIVWGGLNQGSALNTGDKYEPATDSWTSISTTNVPQARSGHTAIWTGTEMIVWAGYGFSAF